jgi:SAM-dependent methyltransferase
MKVIADFVPDIEEGRRRLLGSELTHFTSRVQKAAHILLELTAAGIEPEKPLKTFFVGSGVGFIPYILARHTAWEIHGGDLNETFLRKYPWVQERVHLTRLDGTAMPYPDQSFDVVVCNHVIEHVYDWEALISEIYRVQKKDGLPYLATPNLHGFYRPDVPLKVFWLKILFRNKAKISRDARITLHMGLSPAEIERLLADFARLKNLNRDHILINCPPLLRLPFILAPEAACHRFAPNHVVIANK